MLNPIIQKAQAGFFWKIRKTRKGESFESLKFRKHNTDVRTRTAEKSV